MQGFQNLNILLSAMENFMLCLCIDPPSPFQLQSLTEKQIADARKKFEEYDTVSAWLICAFPSNASSFLQTCPKETMNVLNIDMWDKIVLPNMIFIDLTWVNIRSSSISVQCPSSTFWRLLTLSLHAGLLGCFHNPLNSDMDRGEVMLNVLGCRLTY